MTIPVQRCATPFGAHSWVAGAMRVDEQDLPTVVAARDVTCEGCEVVLHRGCDVPDEYVWNEYGPYLEIGD